MAQQDLAHFGEANPQPDPEEAQYALPGDEELKDKEQ